MLLDVQPLDFSQFGDSVTRLLGRSPQSEVLVFIHGFSVSFAEAARRTAQIAYDLDFAGTPVFYSWPSRGRFSLTNYTADEATVERAIPHLRQFLDSVLARAGSRRVHVVAHSMGNRVLTSVLREYARTIHEPLFNQIILAAPDVDAEVFLEQIAPAIATSSERVTLYASGADKALQLSKRVHQYVRAGESAERIANVKGIDVIDASYLDTDLIGHSYFGSSRLVLNDMFAVLRNKSTPRERNLRYRAIPPGGVWLFPR